MSDGALNAFGSVEIANSELLSCHVPIAGCALSELVRFAYTFDGYLHAGSRDLASAIFRQRSRAFHTDQEWTGTLTEARICLFFSARHFYRDYEGSVEYVEPFMRQLVEIVANQLAGKDGVR